MIKEWTSLIQVYHTNLKIFFSKCRSAVIPQRKFKKISSLTIKGSSQVRIASSWYDILITQFRIPLHHCTTAWTVSLHTVSLYHLHRMHIYDNFDHCYGSNSSLCLTLIITIFLSLIIFLFNKLFILINLICITPARSCTIVSLHHCITAS